MSQSITNQGFKSGKGPGLSNISPLLRFLCGFQIEIECKNGQIYQGILHSCDDCMNILLKDGYKIQNQKCDVSKDHSHDSNYPSSNKRRKKQELEKDITIVSEPLDSKTTYRRNNNNEMGKMYDDKTNDISDVKSSYIHDEISKLLHIRGSNVRYVHIPSNVNIPSMIRDGLDRERSARNKYKRGLRK